MNTWKSQFLLLISALILIPLATLGVLTIAQDGASAPPDPGLMVKKTGNAKRKATNLIPTPSFAYGTGMWARYIDKRGGGKFNSDVTTLSGSKVLFLSRTGGKPGHGFVQRFMDIPLRKNEVYHLSVSGMVKNLMPGTKEVARVAIATRKLWYARYTQLDFTTATERMQRKTITFKARKTGLHRLSVVLERSPGIFYVDKLYLSTAAGEYFDGDTPGAKWGGKKGSSASVYTPSNPRD